MPEISIGPDDTGATTNVVVVSNRGPFAFRRNESGSLVPTRASGGLVACLGPAIAGTGAMWITACIEDDEQQGGDTVEAGGYALRTVGLSAEVYRRYYDVIANGTLWFLHHNLFDMTRRPRIDTHWWEAWRTYCEVNERFVQAVAANAPQDATVLVHDYHLTMLGGRLAELRPDLKTVHFHHSPFTSADGLMTLPTEARQALMAGLAGHSACGFNSKRWADNFKMCCEEVLGRAPHTFVSAATPDTTDLRSVSETEECVTARSALESLAKQTKLIVRVDRIELSKNLLRGFHAFDDLLQRHPEWRSNVTFAAFVYPSREGLAEYLAYRNEVQGIVDQVNSRWATSDWIPIVLHTSDNFPQSLAALMLYDVLLVNPIRDGLNLVAKEGAIMNERNGVVVLSEGAGSYDELQEAVIGINPFDVVQTSDALVEALEMGDDEREAMSAKLRQVATARAPQDWLDDQLRAVRS